MALSIAAVWMLAGGALIGLEALAIPGIGLLFAGLGAVLTGVALLIAPGLSVYLQFALFFIFTSVWAALLWKPLMRLRQTPGAGYNDMVGRRVTVGPERLAKGAAGQVLWSGSTLTARLSENAPTPRAEPGAEMIITAVNAGVVEVDFVN
ncbi:MAG: hypothetical protein HY804_09865 [Nitrospinae bacterium]|nr:hypothetical protein [Nitrospinota bacterium]